MSTAIQNDAHQIDLYLQAKGLPSDEIEAAVDLFRQRFPIGLTADWILDGFCEIPADELIPLFRSNDIGGLKDRVLAFVTRPLVAQAKQQVINQRAQDAEQHSGLYATRVLNLTRMFLET